MKMATQTYFDWIFIPIILFGVMMFFCRKVPDQVFKYISIVTVIAFLILLGMVYGR